MRLGPGDSTGAPRAGALQLLLHLPSLLRLYWRLVRDPRVPLWPKAFLAGAVGYVILPFDLLPDMIPLLGRLDDVTVVILAARWFMQWCPPEIVREHVRAISAGQPS